MLQQTSLTAFEEVKKELGFKQSEVYLLLKSLETANNTILAYKLGWSINRVTPRILELRKMGLVQKDSVRTCPITKRLSIFWSCVK